MPQSKELAVIGKPAVKFDYAGFTAEEKEAARKDEGLVAALYENAKSSTIAIGTILYQAKQRLGHGKYERWVDAAFGHMFTLRTALRYREQARASLEPPKSDKLSDLPKAKTKNQTKVDRGASQVAAADAAVEILNRALSDADLRQFVENYQKAGASAFLKALDPHAS